MKNTKQTEQNTKIIANAEALRMQVQTLTGREYSERGWANEMGVSPTTWSRLKKGEYVARTQEQWLAVQKACVALRSKYVDNQTFRPKEFFEFADFTILKEAVIRALANSREKNIKRIAWYIATPGGGKTQTGRELVEQLNEGIEKDEIIVRSEAKLITARHSWNTSYFAALQALGRAIGLTDLRSVLAAEDQILATLNLGSYTLVIDEPSGLIGRPILTFLRTIANETGAVLVFLCQPKFYGDLCKRAREKPDGDEAQLLRRNIVTVAFNGVLSGDAAQFLKRAFPDLPTAELKPLATSLAKLASAWGGYDTCAEVVSAMLAQADSSLAALETAAASYHSTVGFRG